MTQSWETLRWNFARLILDFKLDRFVKLVVFTTVYKGNIMLFARLTPIPPPLTKNNLFVIIPPVDFRYYNSKSEICILETFPMVDFSFNTL